MEQLKSFDSPCGGVGVCVCTVQGRVYCWVMGELGPVDFYVKYTYEIHLSQIESIADKALVRSHD